MAGLSLSSSHTPSSSPIKPIPPPPFTLLPPVLPSPAAPSPSSCPSSASLPSSSSSPPSSSLSFSSLPAHLHRLFSYPDLLLYSSRFLSLSDLLTLSSVSSLIRAIADSDKLWRHRLVHAMGIARPPRMTREQLRDLYAQAGYDHVSAEGWKEEEDEDDGDEEAEGEGEEEGGEGISLASTMSSASSSFGLDAPLMADASSYSPSSSPLAVLTPPSPPSSSPLPSPASCKARLLALLQCAHSPYAQCRRLLPPCPPLPLPHPRTHQDYHVNFHYPSPPHPTHPTPVPTFSLCSHCLSSLAATVKDYYDLRGPWMGEFTITPLSIVHVQPGVLDVRYYHVGGYEGVDYRRFEVEWVGWGWGVREMLDFRSGIYAMDSAENVQRSARLEYSVLKERSAGNRRGGSRKRKSQSQAVQAAE